MDTFALPEGATLLATGDDVAQPGLPARRPHVGDPVPLRDRPAEIELWLGEVDRHRRGRVGQDPAMRSAPRPTAPPGGARARRAPRCSAGSPRSRRSGREPGYRGADRGRRLPPRRHAGRPLARRRLRRARSLPRGAPASGRAHGDRLARARPATPTSCSRRSTACCSCGGGDVDPARYGAEPDTEHDYGVEPDRDAFEIDAAACRRPHAHARRSCICRGMQVMNVAFGGTLHQHLPGDARAPRARRPARGHGDDPRRRARRGDRCSPATTKARGASLRLAPPPGHRSASASGCRVVGRSPDGLVEAIEPRGRRHQPGDDLDARGPVAPRGDGRERPGAAAAVRRARANRQLLRRVAAAPPTARHARAYRVVDPDPRLAERCSSARRRGSWPRCPAGLVARIDHVGSTSVPGLAAKPVVDIQLSVSAIVTGRGLRGARSSGSGTGHALDPWNDDHEFFCRPTTAEYGAMNLHVCDGRLGVGAAAPRVPDWLRAHPDDAAGLRRPQAVLAERIPRTSSSYLDGKTEFIELDRPRPPGGSRHDEPSCGRIAGFRAAPGWKPEEPHGGRSSACRASGDPRDQVRPTASPMAARSACVRRAAPTSTPATSSAQGVVGERTATGVRHDRGGLGQGRLRRRAPGNAPTTSTPCSRTPRST